MMANSLEVLKNKALTDSNGISQAVLVSYRTFLGTTGHMIGNAKLLDNIQIYYSTINLYRFLYQTMDYLHPENAAETKIRISENIEVIRQKLIE